MKEFLVVYDVVGFETKELAEEQAERFNVLFEQMELKAPTHKIKFRVMTLENGRRVDG